MLGGVGNNPSPRLPRTGTKSPARPRWPRTKSPCSAGRRHPPGSACIVARSSRKGKLQSMVVSVGPGLRQRTGTLCSSRRLKTNLADRCRKLANDNNDVCLLSPHWMGPFKVLAHTAPNTYHLDVPATWRTCAEFNVQRLRPCLRRHDHLGCEAAPPPGIGAAGPSSVVEIRFRRVLELGVLEFVSV